MRVAELDNGGAGLALGRSPRRPKQQCHQSRYQMLIDGLGLQRDSVVNFIKSSRPTYPQFEAWVKTQPGVKLDKGSIEKLNAAIRGYIHDDGTRKSILGASSIPDDPSAPRDAVN